MGVFGVSVGGKVVTASGRDGLGVRGVRVGFGVTGCSVGRGVRGVRVGFGVTGFSVGSGVSGVRVGFGVTGCSVGRGVRGVRVGFGVTGFSVGFGVGRGVRGFDVLSGGKLMLMLLEPPCAKNSRLSWMRNSFSFSISLTLSSGNSLSLSFIVVENNFSNVVSIISSLRIRRAAAASLSSASLSSART